MIIDQVKNDVRTNAQTVEEMTVQVDSTSLALELENLYTNPHKAIVRELASNAYDSHVQANNKEAFFIQIPTNLDPIFKIRDFGTGLSPEDVHRYLNRLYSGTKRTDNTQLGGFGLGSKSPFALVDTVYLTSFKDGMAHNFLWYKNEHGTPTLVIQNSTETDQPNGILYNVPLELKDVSIIADACTDVLFTSKIQPRFFEDLDNLDSEISAFENVGITTLYRGTTFSIYTKPTKTLTGYYHYVQEAIHLSIGGVLYPLPNSIRYKIEMHPMFHQAFNGKNYFVVEVPIGLVKLPKNRETILETNENSLIILKLIKEATENYVNIFLRDEFLETLQTTFITNFAQLFTMLHTYAISKGTHLRQIISLFESELKLEQPDGIFKDLFTTPAENALKLLCCAYQSRQEVNVHRYYPEIQFFTFKPVDTATYKTSARRSEFTGMIERLGLNQNEKVLFIFTGSKKFYSANLTTIKDIEDYTHIFRVDLDKDLPVAQADKDRFLAILEILIPIYYPNSKVLYCGNIETAPRTVATQSRTVSYLFNIRQIYLNNYGRTNTYSNAVPIMHMYDEDENKVSLNLSYFEGEDKVLYINSENVNTYLSSQMLEHYRNLGYQHVYIVKPKLIEDFVKMFEDSDIELYNFENHEAAHDLSDIDPAIVQQYLTLCTIKKASANYEIFTKLLNVFSHKFPDLNFNAYSNQQTYYSRPSVAIPPSLFSQISLHLKEEVLFQRYPLSENLFESLSSVEKDALIKSLLPPELYQSIQIVEKADV